MRYKNYIRAIAGHMLAIESGIRQYDKFGKKINKGIKGENTYKYKGVTFDFISYMGKIVFLNNDPIQSIDSIMTNVVDQLKNMDDEYIINKRPMGIRNNVNYSMLITEPSYDMVNWTQRFGTAFRCVLPENKFSLNNVKISDSNVIFKWHYILPDVPYLVIEESCNGRMSLDYLNLAPSTIIVHNGSLNLEHGERLFNYPQLSHYEGTNVKKLLTTRIKICPVGQQPLEREILKYMGLVDKNLRCCNLPVNSVIPWDKVQFLRRDKSIEINKQLEQPFDFIEQEKLEAAEVIDGKVSSNTCFISGLPLFGWIYAITCTRREALENIVSNTILVLPHVFEYVNNQIISIKAQFNIVVNITYCPIPIEEILKPINISQLHKDIISTLWEFHGIFNANKQELYAFNPRTKRTYLGRRSFSVSQLLTKIGQFDHLFMFDM